MERLITILNSIEYGIVAPENYSFDQIANAFKQGRVKLPLLRRMGGGGNCASIALIKSAIGSLGFSGIFQSVIIDTNKKRFLIDLIDDEERTYSLSFRNYKYAKRKSSFELNRNDETSLEIFEFSNFCYAVIAEIKRTNYRRNRRYKRAITDLNKGEATKYIYGNLGVDKQKIGDVSIENLGSYKHIVVWNSKHAVYASEGMYDEFFNGHNDTEPLEKLKEIHGNGTNKHNPKGAYGIIQ